MAGFSNSYSLCDIYDRKPHYEVFTYVIFEAGAF